ncbi:hypothetical protein [Corallococcus carmarthensis]|uniref:Uncharacterized protein n=1 Tax=Corallococcus carmarthensis TaxID=2316728 RepID=A0A3A8JUP9_9BACT|nr:hypothetical protein [Corallococcus carmarthensis]RKG96014.1 hypothetical protein D7X32_37350 [Corallococcus carmarthensis]
MKRLLLATCIALLGACFDPLYEDPEALDEASWAVCCVRGQVDTCFCEEASGCEASFRACAGGTCAASLSESCGGAQGSQDGGGGVNLDGGGTDAGTSTDAGTESDAGTSTDGGVDVDAGTDAGVDGGTDAGPQPPPSYEPCCDPNSHRVTTCRCAPSGCGTNPPFTPCASARCALVGESCG